MKRVQTKRSQTPQQSELLAFIECVQRVETCRLFQHVSTMEKLGDAKMDTSRRNMLRQILNIAGAAFVLPSQEWQLEKLLNAKQSNNIINGDLVAFFENAMIARWELYYTGGAIRAAHDLDLW